MKQMRRRVRIALTRIETRVLRAVGLRDPLLARRRRRVRTRRLAREATGDDCLSRPALHGMDMKLNAIIDRDGGFFIEAGAHDGFTQSNTYWLEHFRGWRGLLVEPMPELAAEARLSRPRAVVRECALVSADEPRSQLRMHFGDLMSMVHEAKASDWPSQGTMLGWQDPYELDVEARTLSSLLDEVDGVAEVDLLSLDVEGSEASALRGLDFERHAPRYVLVEIHDKERDQPPIVRALGERYVEHGWLSPVDLLYVRTDVAGTQ